MILEQEPWVGLVIGGCFALWGLAFALFRRRISRAAIAQRMEWDKGRGVKFQHPVVIGIGGSVFCLCGVALAVVSLVRLLT
ncbi:MAG TPA: hypothetical protein PLY19_06920 [Rhodoglobus sp.]|nr:hypothetical protein [Rhodoglobus sp.]HOW01184.1 hypothetical protein [Rhodoglobus sp.]HQJ34622.1 hypothetical protein [Rhodoglobus sp.]